MTKKSRNRFLLVVGAVVGLSLIGGNLGVKALERLMIYYPLNDHDFATPENPLKPMDIYWTSDDGVKTHGWFLENPQSSKVLVYFHGNAGSIAGRYPWALQLMNAGVSVLMVEYRGYGRSEGEPSEDGIYRDAEAVWQWLVNTQKIAPENIVLYGKSLGGGPATELATRYPAGALVLQSTFTSIPDMAKRVLPWVPKFLVQTQFDNEKKLKAVKSPTLLIHSRADDLIPFEHSVRNANAANQLVAHLAFDGYGHNDLVAGEGAAIVEAISNLVGDN